MSDVFSALDNNPVIPVLVVEKLEHAVPMAEALVEGGVTALEVTLRTPIALDVIEAIAKSVPEAIAGVGTVVTPAQMTQAKNAGAKFAVSPGLTETLAQSAKAENMPYLPGAVTASEIIRAIELGITDLKFFPASISGGAPALKAFASVFGNVRFCPTGGVNEANMLDFLSLPNVQAVGGSWLVTSKMLESGDWKGITALARAAREKAAG